MSSGDLVIAEPRTVLALDAESGSSGNGVWVAIGAWSKQAVINIKTGGTWNGTWTVYGSNDLAPGATDGTSIQSGAGSDGDAAVGLADQCPLMVRVGWTGRSAGSITATFTGRK